MGLPDEQRKGFHFDGKDPKEAAFENMPRFERHRGALGRIVKLCPQRPPVGTKTLENFQKLA